MPSDTKTQKPDPIKQKLEELEQLKKQLHPGMLIVEDGDRIDTKGYRYVVHLKSGSEAVVYHHAPYEDVIQEWTDMRSAKALLMFRGNTDGLGDGAGAFDAADIAGIRYYNAVDAALAEGEAEEDDEEEEGDEGEPKKDDPLAGFRT